MNAKYFCIHEKGGASITPIHDGKARLDIYNKYGIGIKMDVYASMSGARRALKRFCDNFALPFYEINDERFKKMFVEKTDGVYDTLCGDELVERKNVIVQTFLVMYGGVPYDVEIVASPQNVGGTVEIVYDAWLCRQNCGIKTHIIGGLKGSHPTKADFISMVAWSIDDDIRFYEDEVARIEESYERED